MPERALPIVCLAWGSLIAAPGALRAKQWHKDGPSLPVEFARQSKGGRMTLVLMDDGAVCNVHWAEVHAKDLNDAVRQLKEREGCVSSAVGRWPNNTGRAYLHEKTIEEWAKAKGIAGVVWTALKPGFAGSRGTPPTVGEVLAYLATLQGEELEAATGYIASTPPETKQPFGRNWEQALKINRTASYN